MGINARFTADFAPFLSAVKKAEAEMKSFSEGANKVEGALKRMVDNFSGRKLIQEATLMAEAINRVEGGLKGLTTAEIERVAAKASEATAKMKAMGIEVPPGLQKIVDQTKHVNKGQHELIGTLGKVAAAFGLAFSLGAVVSAVKKVVDMGGALTDLSAKTGFSVKALQEFEFAGKQVGVSLDTITTATAQLENRLGSGDKSALGALKALGISFTEIRGMKPEDQFKLVADKLGEVTDQTAFVKLGMDLMGKGFLETAPLIRADLEEMIDRAHQLGVVLSDETIKNLDELGDSMASLKAVGQATMADVLKPFVPLLTEVAKALMGASGWIGKAQIALEQFLSIVFNKLRSVTDFVIKMEELTNVFGMNDKIIKQLKQSSADFNEIGKQLSETQTKVAISTKDTAKAAGVLNVEYDKSDQNARSASAAQRRLLESTEKLEGKYRDLRNEIGVRQQEAWLASQKAMTSFDRVATTTLIPSLQNIQKNIPIDELLAFDRVTTLKLIPSIGKLSTEIEKVPPALATWKDGLGDLSQSLSQLAQISGDSFGGIVQDIAVLIASMDVAGKSTSVFMKGLAEIQSGKTASGLTGVAAGAIGVASAFQQATKGAGKLEGTLKGAAIGFSVGGPWGAAIGAAAGFIKGLFKNEEKTVNPLRQKFIDAAGGLDIMAERARKAGVDVKALLNAKTVKDYEEAIKGLNVALQFQDDAMAFLAETTKKYGFTLQELGPAFARQELDKQAQLLFKEFEALNAAGIDVVAITTRMADAVNAYVKDAMAMGLEVPAAMRPMLQRMIDMGLLTDAAGNVITDLEAAGVSFALTMSEGFKALIDEVKALTDAISRGLGLAIRNIPKIDVGVSGPTSEVPELGSGMAGLRFGGSRVSGADMVIQTNLIADGRQLAAVTSRVQHDEFKLRNRLQAA